MVDGEQFGMLWTVDDDRKSLLQDRQLARRRPRAAVSDEGEGANLVGQRSVASRPAFFKSYASEKRIHPQIWRLSKLRKSKISLKTSRTLKIWMLSTRTIAGAGGRNFLRRPTYNVLHFPVELKVSDVSATCRLVTEHERTAIQIAENHDLVNRLQKIFAKANFPFFTTVSDLVLSFAVDKKFCRSPNTLHKVVFKTLRKSPTVSHVLESMRSSLKVVLSVYNGDEFHILTWSDFFFLSGYRNLMQLSVSQSSLKWMLRLRRR